MVETTKEEIVNMLEGYIEGKIIIKAMEYDLNHLFIGSNEMIEAMNFGHSDINASGLSKGYISDKTFYIAANYMNRVEKAKREIADGLEEQNKLKRRLTSMEGTYSRLEYFVSLLKGENNKIIKGIYFEGKTQKQLGKELGYTDKSIGSKRDKAIEELYNMYNHGTVTQSKG